MVIYAPTDISLTLEEERTLSNPCEHEISVTHFCEFIDFYTRHATDPLYTAAACQQQADMVHIPPQDVTPETIQMLIHTLLAAVDHLEKKWLDEQIQHEERKQRHRQDVAQLYQQFTEGQQQIHTGLSYLYQRGIAFIRQLFTPIKLSPKKRKALKRRCPRKDTVIYKS